MNLDWMMLANYAEAGSNGLLYISGGGWDTITIGAPLEGAPPGVFGVLQGTLVVRLLFHQTETGQDHTFTLTIVDEDGGEIGKAEGNIRVDKTPGLPPGWPQNVNIPLPLAGIPLPKPGLYTMSLQVNGAHLGDRPFRVLKGY
jgi:Family of unknown function (DUF6941)